MIIDMDISYDDAVFSASKYKTRLIMLETISFRIPMITKSTIHKGEVICLNENYLNLLSYISPEDTLI